MASDIQKELGLSNEQFGKLRQYNRILISYNDFQQVNGIASILLDGGYYKGYPRENRLLVLALYMAAIVAYSRPFVDSKGELATNRIPGKILRVLTEEEAEVHSVVLEDWHTMMAHSDADANMAIPLVAESNGKPLVVPKNASPYARPLLREAMVLLRSMSIKLQEACYDMRQEMEPEIIGFIPRAHWENPEDA